MTPERWRQIETLYHAVLELPPEERERRLSAADDEVRSEVESLLRNGDSKGMLDGRAIEVAAQEYVSVETPDLSGRKLGRYEVIAHLGAGGMGVVYRARDTRLNRDVALKVLPAASIADAARKRHFVQEARAASALNHPNIISVHDIDQIDGIDFITMECVSGNTLAEVIGHKATPVREALVYGIQIAGALAAAHAAGIIHRDLKPGNVMVTAEGQVKVLDFGLAKLDEPPEGGESTASGAIAGTPAYMSPEQAEGKKMDARSDIFSFGAVMYEMLTGRPAFGRDSMSATIAAVLRDDPAPLTESAPGLQRLVRQCLRKDVSRRYQSMADVRIALEDLKEEPEVLAAPVAKRGHKWPVFVGGAVTLAVAAGGVWFLLNPKDIGAPPPVTQVTFDGRLAMNPTVSADGKYVAYASDRAGQGNLDIWVQALPTGQPKQFTKDEANEDYPSFSPDGTNIAFRSDRDGGGIYVMSILGGEPHLLARNPGRPLYSPDGKHVLCSPVDLRSLYKAVIVPAEGGEPRKVRGADRFMFPIWSPDAKRILAVGYTLPSIPATTWFVLPLAAGPAIASYERTDGPGAGTPLAWLRDNRILFAAHSGDAVNLWLARVSPDGLKTANPFQRLTSGAGYITSASVGGNGTVVFSNTTAPTRIWSLPIPKEGQRSEGDLLAFPSSGSLDYFPSVSDSGKMAYLSHKSGKWDLWIRDLRNGRETWLASVEGTNAYSVSAVIKPDGSSVAYSGCRADWTCDVFQVAATGGLPARICDHCGQVRAWSSDGTVMASQVFGTPLSGTQRSGFIDRIDPKTGDRTVMAETPGVELYAPDFSPDGRWIAFQATPSDITTPGMQLFVAPLNAPLPIEPARWITVTNLGHNIDAQAKWARDGRMLYFTSDRDGSTCLWAVRLDGATKKPLGEPFAVRHFHASPRKYSDAVPPIFSLGPDRIVISLEQVQSDLWMMQLPER